MNIFFVTREKLFLLFALFSFWFLRKMNIEYTYYTADNKTRYRRHRVSHVWQREIVLECELRKPLIGRMKLESKQSIWESVTGIKARRLEKKINAT